jgi:hypothetical protein
MAWYKDNEDTSLRGFNDELKITELVRLLMEAIDSGHTTIKVSVELDSDEDNTWVQNIMLVAKS